MQLSVSTCLLTLSWHLNWQSSFQKELWEKISWKELLLGWLFHKEYSNFFPETHLFRSLGCRNEKILSELQTGKNQHSDLILLINWEWQTERKQNQQCKALTPAKLSTQKAFCFKIIEHNWRENSFFVFFFCQTHLTHHCILWSQNTYVCNTWDRWPCVSGLFQIKCD